MSKPFNTPFAENGDVMFIPETAQADGSVSYETGFGPDYSADPLDANVKPVPRAGHNELFNQITGSIGDIQRHGAADWYQEFAEDGGYPKNAIVWLDGDRWKSQIDGNSTRPNIDEIAWLPSAKFEGGGGGGGGNFGLTGPTTIAVGGSFQYKISPYSSFMTYAVSATNGTATISGDTITLTIAPGETANVTDLTVVRSDGARNDFRIAIGAQSIAKPSILSPAGGAVDVNLGPILTASPFVTYPDGADTHLNTDWRIRTMAGAVVWQSLANSTNKTNIQVPDNTLPLNTQLQVDVRYRGATLPVSAYSDPVLFTTTNQSITTPTITSPLSGATGILRMPTFTASAFSTNPPGADTHSSSNWRLKNAVAEVIWSSIGDAVNKTSITLPAGVLAVSTQYTMEVQYNGSILQPSPWSPVVSFTTAATFAFDRYLAVVGMGPTLKIYGQDVDTFNNLDTPAVLPSGNISRAAAWTPDGAHFATTQETTPFIKLYKRNGDNLEPLANPAALPTSIVTGVAYSGDGVYMALSLKSEPYMAWYKRNGDVYTKLVNPQGNELPKSSAYSVGFSADSNYLAIGHARSPYFSSYRRSGDTLVRMGNPAVNPGSECTSVSLSSDGTYLACALISSITLALYKKVSEAWIKLDNPANIPVTNGSTGIAFSADDLNVAVVSPVSTSPLMNYKRNGDVFILEGGSNAITGFATGVCYSGDGNYIAVTSDSTPFLAIFKKATNGGLARLPNPDSLPTAKAFAVALCPPVPGA